LTDSKKDIRVIIQYSDTVSTDELDKLTMKIHEIPLDSIIIPESIDTLTNSQLLILKKQIESLIITRESNEN